MHLHDTGRWQKISWKGKGLHKLIPSKGILPFPKLGPRLVYCCKSTSKHTDVGPNLIICSMFLVEPRPDVGLQYVFK